MNSRSGTKITVKKLFHKNVKRQNEFSENKKKYIEQIIKIAKMYSIINYKLNLKIVR